jgi:hypothetical protein
MGRLIEVQNVQGLPSHVTLRVGDVLHVNATGGRVQSGDDTIEMLGAFVPAVAGNNGEVFTAMSAPNTVLFRAIQLGDAVVEIITGDPWRAPRSTSLHVRIES